MAKRTTKRNTAVKVEAKRKRGPKEANPEAYKKFVAIWQSSATKAEVVEETGLSSVKAGSWAYVLRKKGVPLKKFKHRPLFDLKELTAIAKKALRA